MNLKILENYLKTIKLPVIWALTLFLTGDELHEDIFSYIGSSRVRSRLVAG